MGISFIFFMTTLGASFVYFFKNEPSKKWNALFLGFASGVMLSASVWSLLLPAVEESVQKWGKFAFVPAALGFIVGGVFLAIFDKILHFYTQKRNRVQQKGLKSALNLFFAVSVHNIPEGLAVGFAFGTARAIGTTPAYISALLVAFGIGIQNLPEGTAVALPLRSVLHSKNKAFLWGMVSGVFEPVFAVIGYFLARQISFLQPWLLSFSAGAMVFVTCKELIPSATEQDSDGIPYGTLAALVGFSVMMTLDLAFG